MLKLKHYAIQISSEVMHARQTSARLTLLQIVTTGLFEMQMLIAYTQIHETLLPELFHDSFFQIKF